MAGDEQATRLDPKVAFSLDAIIAAEVDIGADEAPLVDTEFGLEAEFKLNPGEVIAEAYREVTGIALVQIPEGGPHSFYPAAGAGAVIYLLQQLQPWLSTAADLAQLGSLGLLILEKVREKLGSDRQAVVFSREIVEAMCLRRLEEWLGTELGKVSVRSHAFHRYAGEPVAPQYRMNGTAIYLIWISAETIGHTYIFLVDSRGKVWGEWDTWGVSHLETSKSPFAEGR